MPETTFKKSCAWKHLYDYDLNVPEISVYFADEQTLIVDSSHHC